MPLLRCPNEGCTGAVLPSASPTLPASKAQDWWGTIMMMKWPTMTFLGYKWHHWMIKIIIRRSFRACNKLPRESATNSTHYLQGLQQIHHSIFGVCNKFNKLFLGFATSSTHYLKGLHQIQHIIFRVCKKFNKWSSGFATNVQLQYHAVAFSQCKVVARKWLVST